MALARQAPLPARRPLRMTKNARPETPHEVIESEAYEAAAELVYYRDIDQPARLRGDAGCDEAVKRMEMAFRNGDAPAFWAAADDYWSNDAEEDAAGLRGDGRVSVAHTHIRIIPAQVMEIEMGAHPGTAADRQLTDRRRGRAAQRAGGQQR